MSNQGASAFEGAVYGYPAIVNGERQSHSLWGMRGSIEPVASAPTLPQLLAGPDTFVTNEIDVSGGTSGSGTLRILGDGTATASVAAVGVAVAGGTYPAMPYNVIAKLTTSMLALIRTVAPATTHSASWAPGLEASQARAPPEGPHAICQGRGTLCPLTQNVFLHDCAAVGLELQCFNNAGMQCCEFASPSPPPPTPPPPLSPPTPPPRAPPALPPPYDVCSSYGKGIYYRDGYEWPTLCGANQGHCAAQTVQPGETKHVLVCGMWHVTHDSAETFVLRHDMGLAPMFASVGPGAHLYVEVLDSAIVSTSDGGPIDRLELHVPLMPTLVASAAKDSHVELVVRGSAHANVRFGLDMPSGGALMDKLVFADEGATIEVSVEDSARIVAQRNAYLHVDEAALMKTLVTVRRTQFMLSSALQTVARTNVTATVARSGSVDMANGGNANAEGSLTFDHNASLVDPIVDLHAADATAALSTYEVAIIEAPRARVSVSDSYLLAGHVRLKAYPPSATECARADVSVDTTHAARIEALSLELYGSSVVEESIDLKVPEAMCVQANMTAHLVGAALLEVTDQLYMQGSQLLDETLDIDVHEHAQGDGLQLNADVSLEGCANVVAGSSTCMIKVYNSSELIVRRRRLDGPRATRPWLVRLPCCARACGRTHALSPSPLPPLRVRPGSLLPLRPPLPFAQDETFDLQLPYQHYAACNHPSCCQRLDLNVSVRVADSGNLNTAGSIDFYSGEILDESFDVAGCFGSDSVVNARVNISNTANIHAVGVNIFDGDIMDEAIDIDGNTTGGHWSITVEMLNVASINAVELHICEGEVQTRFRSSNLWLTPCCV